MKNINGYNYKELFSMAIEKPMLAQIEITKNCNQKCDFCFRLCHSEKTFKDQPVWKWQQAIKKLFELGIKEINFSGGEVLLFKNIDKIFQYSGQLGIKNYINTNGTVDLKKINLKYVDHIIFSVHGLRSKHDQVVGLKGAFEKIVDNLRCCLKKNIPVAINTVLTEKNFQQKERIYKFFEKESLKYHCFNLYIDQIAPIQYQGWLKEIFPKYLKFLKTIPAERRKLRHGLQNIVEDKNFFKARIPLPNCAGGKYKIVIDYKGDLYPCRYFQNEEFYSGNIFKDSLKKCWQLGAGFKKFRQQALLEKNLPETCSSCFKRFRCLGGCLAWRQKNKHNLYEKDPRCSIGNAFIRG